MFRTEVYIGVNFPEISYNSKILFIGSCFADNIGSKFIDSGFNINLNPFGIIYNPASIYDNVKMLIEYKQIHEDDLLCNNNKWFNYRFHGKFSNENKQKCLVDINNSLKVSANYLKEADYVFFTFGTAWVYKLRNGGGNVANCHKLPSSVFERYKLSISEIVEMYNGLINEIKQINKKVKFVFTVSPVRHFKDGTNGNQLSKSTLLLAIDEIIKLNNNSYYFPSYEIVLDELRDYRFYKDDMLHISNVAVDYIWKRFVSVFFNDKTKELSALLQKLNKSANHKPSNSNSLEYIKLVSRNLKKIEQLENKYSVNLTEYKQRFNKTEKGE